MVFDMDFRALSRPIRHRIVRTIAPRVWESAIRGDPLSSYPRPMVEFARDYFNGGLVTCAEIGVSTGANSISILEELNVRKIFCIDPYLPYTDRGTVYKLSLTSHNNTQFELAKENLAKYGDRVKFIKKKAERALGAVTSRLDFLYIDGNHSYDVVKWDIENYWYKIKRGGLIGGHDLYARFTGVVIAVTDFAREYNLKLYSDLADWWFIKR